MAKKYANAYRVVSRDTVQAYEIGDFSAVPNLDGAYMKKTFKVLVCLTKRLNNVII